MLAETILDGPVPREIGRKLRFVAIEEPRHARLEFESWLIAGDRSGAADPRWPALLAQESFIDFANSLVDNFTLLAADAPEPGTRKLVKLSYEERFDNDADGADWKRHLVRLGWTRCSVEIDVPAVSFSESYHLEVEAPGDLEIDAAQIRFEGGSSNSGKPPRGPTAGGGVRRAHLYASGVASEFQGKALVFLRRRRDAFLWSAFLTALLVSLLLLSGRFRLGYLLGDENTDQSQTAAALLLITPTFLAAYIARSGEHLLASKVLLGVRAMVIGAGFCAVVAVCVLTAGLSLYASKVIWMVHLCLSLAITLCLLLSLLLPRPTRE
ncbi:MAG TPA: hypothetical protein VHR18_05400 [Solirubrobacterales bacterium]|nr:hypothetical protein [Solirubrobacterales bacterium]